MKRITTCSLSIIMLLLFCNYSIAQTVHLSENFSTGSGTTPPTGWTNNIIAGNSGYDIWRYNNPGGRGPSSPIAGQFAIFDSDNLSSGGGAENVALESPSVNTTGYTTVKLKWDQFFAGVYNVTDGIFVEVWNGATWNVVYSNTTLAYPGTASSQDIDVSAYAANIASTKVRFRWVGDWSWWWIVDNVQLYSPAPATINTHPASVSLPCPTGNTSFSVTATGASLTYQWQENTGGGFVNISNGGIYSGATTATLTLTGASLGMNNYSYRCEVAAATPPVAISNAATLTVANPQITSTTPGTACYGNPGSVSATANGTYSIQWYDASVGGNIVGSGNTLNIPSATTTTTYYALPNLADTLLVSTAAGNGQNGAMCDIKPLKSFTLDGFDILSQTSGVVTVNVYYKVGTFVGNELTPGAWTLIHSGSANFSVGLNTVMFNTKPPLNAGQIYGYYVSITGTLSYTNGSGVGNPWASNADLEVYQGVGISGTFGGVFTPRCLNGVFRYSSGCPSLTRTPVTLTVIPQPVINTNPSNVAICAASNASFSVTTTGLGVTYRWQENQGGGFTNISNGGVYSNATTSTLNITGATTGMNGYTYRCVAMNAPCTDVISSAATLTITTGGPTIITPPSNVTICQSSNATFSVTAGNSTNAYQWYVIIAGSSIVQLSNGGFYSGVTTNTLTITGATTALSSNQYYCVLGNPCVSLLSFASSTPPATLTVIASLSITAQPNTPAVCPNNTVNVSVSATNATSYQWQFDPGSGVWNNLQASSVYSNVNTPVLTITAPGWGANGYLYRCYISNVVCGALTNTVALSILTPATVSSHPSNSTICTGGNTTFTATGSGSAFGYQWQSGNGVTFSNLTNTGIYSNVTTSTLNITGATTGVSGTQYRCVIIDLACSTSLVSNAGILTVNPSPSITSHPSPTTTCPSVVASFTVAATGLPQSYQWQVDITGTGTSFVNVSGVQYVGATAATLNIYSITVGMNGYLYRCVVGGACAPPVISNSAALSVNTSVTVTINPGNSTVCEGIAASFSASGTGAGIAYQWQENAGLGFVNLSNTGIYTGVTSTTLNLASTTTSMNTYRYRCVMSGTCTSSLLSTAATLTVQMKPVVVNHPLSITKCSGTNTSFAVSAVGTGLGYQWQLSTDGGASWNNLTNVAPYSNVTTATLGLTGVTLGLHNNRYRCVVTGTCAPNANSNGAVLSVYDNPVITLQPSNQSACAGSNAAFSLTVTGAGLSYQWQVNSGLGFSNISNGGIYSNATTSALNITGVLAGMNQYQYQCVVSSGCNSGVFSAAGILTVMQLPAVTVQPVNATVCEGTNSGFSVIGAGTGLGYQWQESTDGGTTWNNIIGGGIYSNVTTNGLSLTGVTAAMNAYRYRCVVTGTCAPNAISNGVLLTVNTSPVITSNPGNRTVCVGGNAPFSVTATGTGLTYQWQVNSGSGFVNIANGGFYSNATTATLTVSGATAVLNGAEYRCIVVGTCPAQATSTGGILTVNSPVAITASPVNSTICTNQYTSFGVTATGTGLVYQWQESTNGGVSWANMTNTSIYGSVNAPLLLISQPTATMNNYRYRCAITGTCTPSAVISGSAILTVNSIPAIVAQSSLTVTQCAGTSTLMSVTATGTSLTYQWQESQNGGLTWNNLINVAPYTNVTTASLTLSATPVTLNGFQYRCLVGGICAPSLLTAAVSLTVNSLPAITLQPLSSTLCQGGNTSFTVNGTGTGIQYQWQLSINSGSTWTNITNNFQYGGAQATTLNVTGVTASMTNYYYRCWVFGTCPPALASSTAIPTVQTPPSLTSQPVDRVLCENTGTTFATSATGTGISYQWQLSQNGGGTWTNLSATAPYSNVTTATLTVSPVAATMDGYLYRCYVSGTCTPAVTSFIGKLTVWTAPVIVSQTTSVQACPGVPATMSVNMTGSNLIYQWQMNSGFGFIAVPTGSIYSGMNTSVLSFSSPSSAQNGYLFRCIISGSCGSPATSATIPLTVYKPVDIVYNPSAVKACIGGTQYIAIKALGNNLVYQWQERVGSVFVNLQNGAPYSNVNGDTLWITNVQDTMNGKVFRCIVTEYTLCNQLYYSAEVTFQVAPAIETEPGSQTLTKWGVAYFKVPMGGLYYQWQEDQGGGNGFVDLTEVPPYLGTHTATLRINPLSETMNGYKYRCIVDGICYTRTSTSPSTLTVTPGTGIAQQPGGKLNYMSVYPNPVSGTSLQVKFEEAVKGTTMVKILDKLGREMYSSRLELAAGLQGNVEVGELAAGVYTLQVTNEQESIRTSVRFTKQ